MIGRRTLLSLGALTASGWLSPTGWSVPDAEALGRVPTGGTLRMRIPWSTRSLDPHDLNDPLAALLAAAIADPVYALDNKGRPYPTLADGMPKVEAGQTVVTLRAGLKSAKGRALGGRDLAWSIKRARSLGAVGLLAKLTPFVRSDKTRPLIARFGTVNPGQLAVLLASPLTALLPVGFNRGSPDGTGAFVATCSATKLVLSRNPNACRGPSFLDKVIVRSATDLTASLKAFESGSDEVGWLGMGMHGQRAGAREFDFGAVGWVVLATGRRAGPHGVPGAAQQLANAVPVERLGLGLQPRRGVRAGTLWNGNPTKLYYDQSCAHLRVVAAAVAAKISQPGHEVTPAAVTRSRLRRMRLLDNYALALDVVRDPLNGLIGPLIALATADRIALGRSTARKPPRINYARTANHLTTSLRIGVLGGLAVRGGVARGITLAAGRMARGLALGGSYRSK